MTLNPKDFTASSIKHWEPDAAWARATGASEDIGLPSSEKVYPSGIRNEVANERGLEYITQAQYADGLLKARREGWDGIDYTDNRVAELKHRMYASIRHDKLLAKAKAERIQALRSHQTPEPEHDNSAWDFEVGGKKPAQPANLHKY